MNTALTVGHPTSIRSHAAPLHERVARRLGLALLAWSRRLEQRRPTREELAELHARRREAEQLRIEQVRLMTISRLL